MVTMLSVFGKKFINMCMYCINNFILDKTKKITKKNSWMTREAQQLKRKIKRLRRQGASRDTILNIQPKLNEIVRNAKKKVLPAYAARFYAKCPGKVLEVLKRKNKVS